MLIKSFPVFVLASLALSYFTPVCELPFLNLGCLFYKPLRFSPHEVCPLHTRASHSRSPSACPNLLDPSFPASQVPMQLTYRRLSSVPLVTTMHYFRLGHRQYLTRPIGYKRHLVKGDREDESEASLATCIWIPKGHSIDAERLRAWRARYLDEDDVFDPAFLQEVIFGGSSDIRLEHDTIQLFETWKTRHVSFVPDMSMINGPCYVHQDNLHTVWRVYDDRQLAFVQAIWPSIDSDRQRLPSSTFAEATLLIINSSYVEVDAAGNGYRGHGIAVPSKSLY